MFSCVDPTTLVCHACGLFVASDLRLFEASDILGLKHFCAEQLIV